MELDKPAILEKGLSRHLLYVSKTEIHTRVNSETYGPSTSNRGHNTSGNHHRLHTAGALEQHSTQGTGNDAIGRIVLPARVANGRVETVINHRDDTGRVAEERTTAGNRVKNTVQPNLGWCGGWCLVQSFCETPRASESQRSQICGASTVAKVVGPAARRQDGSGAGEFIESRVFEGEVVEGVLVQAGQGVQLGGIDGNFGKEGIGILRVRSVIGRGRLALLAAAERVPDGHDERRMGKDKVINLQRRREEEG